jgi:FkbM family methyltransferase
MQEHITTTETRYHKDFAYYVNDSIIGRSLELYGEYGQSELDFFLWLANPEHVIYDIGANIGTYTVAFASSGAQVFAFEPNPKNYALLDTNTKDLNNVKVYHVAVGSKTQKVFCNDFDLDVRSNYGAMNINESSGTAVDMISLDNLAIPAPTMIKIDVEGSEFDVLLGMQNKIKENMPVIVYEAHETKQFAEIFNLLKSLDYRLVWLQCMNYNQKNFKQNTNNVFENTALFSIVAWPPQAPQDILTGHEVTGPDDTWQKFCKPVDNHK